MKQHASVTPALLRPTPPTSPEDSLRHKPSMPGSKRSSGPKIRNSRNRQDSNKTIIIFSVTRPGDWSGQGWVSVLISVVDLIRFWLGQLSDYYNSDHLSARMHILYRCIKTKADTYQRCEHHTDDFGSKELRIKQERHEGDNLRKINE